MILILRRSVSPVAGRPLEWAESRIGLLLRLEAWGGVTSLRERAMREPLRKYQFRLWMLLAIITLLCVLFGAVTRWPIVAWAGTLLAGPSVLYFGFAQVVRENSFRDMLVGAGLIVLGLALLLASPIVLYWLFGQHFNGKWR